MEEGFAQVCVTSCCLSLQNCVMQLFVAIVMMFCVWLLVSQDSTAKGAAPDLTFEAILEFVQRKYK